VANAQVRNRSSGHVIGGYAAEYKGAHLLLYMQVLGLYCVVWNDAFRHGKCLSLHVLLTYSMHGHYDCLPIAAGHAMAEKVKETLHSDLQNIFSRRYA
jgi:hypothetical protein